MRPVNERRCPERPHLFDGYPIGQYHCPYCGCMVLAGMEHLAHDPGCCLLPSIPEDEYLHDLEIADAGYRLLLDPHVDPRELAQIERMKWVWVYGPVEPHWALRPAREVEELELP